MAVQITPDVVEQVKSVLAHTVDKPGLEPNLVCYIENQLNIGLPLMRLIIMEMVTEVTEEAMGYIEAFHAEYNTQVDSYHSKHKPDTDDQFVPWGVS